MSIQFIKEVTTVVENGVVIGYMARRSVIAGMAWDIPNGWVICADIRKPSWTGNYATRKAAREVLQHFRRNRHAKLITNLSRNVVTQQLH